MKKKTQKENRKRNITTLSFRAIMSFRILVFVFFLIRIETHARKVKSMCERLDVVFPLARGGTLTFFYPPPGEPWAAHIVS